MLRAGTVPRRVIEQDPIRMIYSSTRSIRCTPSSLALAILHSPYRASRTSLPVQMLAEDSTWLSFGHLDVSPLRDSWYSPLTYPFTTTQKCSRWILQPL